LLLLLLLLLLNRRLCRPGSIVGPQQQYLASIEARMFREGAEYRLRHRLPNPGAAGAVAAMSDDRSLNSLDGVLSTATGISNNTNTPSITGLSGSNSGSMTLEGRGVTPPLIIKGSYKNGKQPAG
jgi:hypothetical protein